MFSSRTAYAADSLNTIMSFWPGDRLCWTWPDQCEEGKAQLIWVLHPLNVHSKMSKWPIHAVQRKLKLILPYYIAFSYPSCFLSLMLNVLGF